MATLIPQRPVVSTENPRMRIWKDHYTLETMFSINGWGSHTYDEMCRFFGEKRSNEEQITALLAERGALLQRIEELEDTAFTDNEYIAHLENQ